MKKERGLIELYNDDPERADYSVWGRRSCPLSRRGFLRGMGLTALSAALGSHIVFHEYFPQGLIPIALAADGDPLLLQKSELTILNDRPINAETPAHLLDDDVTPISRHFVRNNGLLPAEARTMDARSFSLTIDGEVEKTRTFSLEDLKREFQSVEAQLLIECGGNGRKGFVPGASGNQWTFGAVGCAHYKGIRMADVLKSCGLKASAVFSAYYGSDIHLSGQADKVPISRGTPINKALDPATILAYEMNGEPLPALHGFPLRIVCPGWPGSCSGKWLKRLWIRDRVHDGEKMTGYSYKMPTYPVAPGTHVPEEDMEIIEIMPVKSLITSPKSGIQHSLNEPLTIRGQAWSGEASITAVDISYDFGAHWLKASLKNPVNKHAWQRFSLDLKFPKPGYYEIWARASDSKGDMQPLMVPGWNPKGYLNNAIHRIAVTVA